MSAIYQIKAQLLTPKVEKIHNLVQYHNVVALWISKHLKKAANGYKYGKM